MHDTLKKFESLCQKELELLEEFGFEADIEGITEKKNLLFQEMKDYIHSGHVSEDDKLIILHIRDIQNKSETLYSSFMEDIRKTLDTLRNSRKGIANYKLDISAPSFIDHSG